MVVAVVTVVVASVVVVVTLVVVAAAVVIAVVVTASAFRFRVSAVATYISQTNKQTTTRRGCVSLVGVRGCVACVRMMFTCLHVVMLPFQDVVWAARVSVSCLL